MFSARLSEKRDSVCVFLVSNAAENEMMTLDCFHIKSSVHP